MTSEYIIDENVANKICVVLVNIGENRLANKLCSRPHTSNTGASDEMEQRFTSKSQAWEQGYQDGQSSVQHDINLIEHAIRNETLDAAKKYLEIQYMFFDKERWEQIWQSLRSTKEQP